MIQVDLNIYTPVCMQPNVDTSLFGETAWVYGKFLDLEREAANKIFF